MPMITQPHQGDEFDIDATVNEILDWAGQYAEEQGICPHVMAELLVMAAAKGRILTHWQEEHGDDVGQN
jgi:hypothetical protein